MSERNEGFQGDAEDTISVVKEIRVLVKGLVAAQAKATADNKPSAPCARTDCQYYPGDYECNPCVHNHPWLVDHYTRRTVG